MALDGKQPRWVVQLLADVFIDALKLAAASALSVDRLVMDYGARELRRQWRMYYAIPAERTLHQRTPTWREQTAQRKLCSLLPSLANAICYIDGTHRDILSIQDRSPVTECYPCFAMSKVRCWTLSKEPTPIVVLINRLQPQVQLVHLCGSHIRFCSRGITMSTLLKIDVSPRGSHSVSRAIGELYAKQWDQLHPGGRKIVRDLATTEIPFVDLPWVTAAFSDPATHDIEQSKALALGNDFINELQSADDWLITTPMYNFAVPGRLKAYIDHIVRAGQTFKTHEDGSFTGLLTGKKVTVIVASAGEFTQGSPIAACDHISGYLKSILYVIGVTDVAILLAGSTWKVDSGLTDLPEYLASVVERYPFLANK